MDADVIITVCAPTRACYVAADVAIRTCAAYTDANIIAAANNMLPEFRDPLFATAQALGVRWLLHETTPFNIAKCYNQMIRVTKGKYYAIGGQDVVFYDKWLDNLIAAWEAEPDYFCLSPYLFNVNRKDWDWTLSAAPGIGILETWPSCTATMAFRRDKPWLFDEAIPSECDSDLYWHCKRNGLRTGIVLNSRVDHLGQVVLSELGGWSAVNNQSKGDSERLKAKWNL